MSELRQVPELRFGEFSDEWEENNIKALTSLLKDGSHGTHKEASESNYLLLSAKNITNGSINVYEDDRRITEEDYYQIYRNYNLQKDDVVLTIVGTIGRSALVKEINKIAFQRSVAFFRFKNDSSKFIYQLFNAPNFLKELDRRKVVSAQPGIYLGDLAKIKLTLPSKQEQEKIASFLSSVDSRIEQLTKKEKLLREYKKGVMQKIFSQELRFHPKGISSQAQGNDDDGNEFPEWVEKRLGDFLIHKSIKNKEKKVNLVLSVSNKKGFISQEEQFDGYEVASKDLSNYKIVDNGDYAYNPSRINVGSIARLDNFEKGIVSPMYVVFSLNSLASNFFNALYNTHLFKHLIKIGCSGSVRDSLNFNDMADFKLKMPILQEQTKIANFLSSLDTKIEQANKELNLTKEFKKALLQQMFV